MVRVMEHFAFGVIMFEPRELIQRYKVLEEWNMPWVNYWTVTIERTVMEDPMDEKPTHVDSSGKDFSRVESPVPVGNYASIGELYEDLESAGRGEPSDRTGSSQISHSSDASEHLKPPDGFVRTSSNSSQQSIEQGKDSKHDTGDSGRSAPKPKVTKPHHFITTPSHHLHARSVDKWEKVPVRGVKDEVAAHCGIFILSQNLDYTEFVENVATKVIGWVPRT